MPHLSRVAALAAILALLVAMPTEAQPADPGKQPTTPGAARPDDGPVAAFLDRLEGQPACECA